MVTSTAAVLECDLLKDDDRLRHDPLGECFMCGRGMAYRDNRFCSDRCRDYYDEGNPGYRQDKPEPPRLMRAGRVGFYFDCAYCRKEFESKGLRCCSIECERRYNERQSNLAIMAQVGIEPARKRQCETCGAVIPKWGNGRQCPRKPTPVRENVRARL